jgi:uncharacterized protein YukE
MTSGEGYHVSHSGMSGQAKELDGCGDDAGTICKSVSPTMCYSSDALGGSDSGPAFNKFAAAWEAEARTLEKALHELADKVRLAKNSYRGTDRRVQAHARGVSVPDGQPSTASAPAQRPSALSTY